MKKKLCFILIFTVLLINGCGSQTKMKDGFYTAEMSDYSHGWKEYICIMVKDGKIVSAEFNAKNQSGYIKAWDNSYMKNMYAVTGTYPNEYTRYYTAELLKQQDDSGVDALSGASHSGGNFNKLAAAVIEQAIKGNSETIWVETEAEE